MKNTLKLWVYLTLAMLALKAPFVLAQHSPFMDIDSSRFGVEQKKWKVWKTITIGDKTCAELKKELKPAYNYWIDTFPVESQRREIDLVLVRAKEIYDGPYYTYPHMCKIAYFMGLQLCPPETAIQLRLQYKDQPSGSAGNNEKWSISVASLLPPRNETECCAESSIGRVLNLADGKYIKEVGIGIRGFCTHYDHLFDIIDPEEFFVFVLPRKNLALKK